ncbi:unnamed protein product [Euphydryas editha]|uniref:PHD-type domain-containing protein n=1 Tax=Euphydryas editha TaxID=104508 RepID=A0AAU9UC68_EUPED|nr:unnamed protein product [Euphydryas editha]
MFSELRTLRWQCRRGKTAIITSTPYKKEVEERKRAAIPTVDNRTAKKAKDKGKGKGKGKGTRKKSQEDTTCIYCNDENNSYLKSSENWAKCQRCERWAHTACARVDDDDMEDILICIFCEENKSPSNLGPYLAPFLVSRLTPYVRLECFDQNLNFGKQQVHDTDDVKMDLPSINLYWVINASTNLPPVTKQHFQLYYNHGQEEYNKRFRILILNHPSKIPFKQLYEPANPYAVEWDHAYHKENTESNILNKFDLICIILEYVAQIEHETCEQFLSKHWNVKEMVDEMKMRLLTRKSDTALQIQLMTIKQRNKSKEQYGREIEDVFFQLQLPDEHLANVSEKENYEPTPSTSIEFILKKSRKKLLKKAGCKSWRINERKWMETRCRPSTLTEFDRGSLVSSVLQMLTAEIRSNEIKVKIRTSAGTCDMSRWPCRSAITETSSRLIDLGVFERRLTTLSISFEVLNDSSQAWTEENRRLVNLGLTSPRFNEPVCIRPTTA